MNKQNIEDKIEIILWLNGKEKDYSFKLQLPSKSSLSINYLKELILKTIISCKELNSTFSHLNFNQIHTLYNQKEIPLEDNDIQYLKNNEIIFFTFDSSSFKSSNHFNQYQFIRWIKSGGYGQVFLANHVYTKKEYAIKQINTTGFSNEDLYNISREHLILRSMIHKNVIRCYDSFAHDNKFYTVMDFAEGGELSVLLKDKGILPESEAKTIFKQIYDAVCYIHGQNIIHRDLKPNNILFLDKEKTHIVIIDFGISGMANGNQREKIKAGTTSFLPPEIASGEEYSSNPKIDIWALGIILYLMVQGCYPFEGKTTKDIIKSILRDKLEFNKKIKISAPLKTLIGGMLEKNYRFRIDDDADLFDKWFNYTGPAIKRKKTMDEKNIKKKTENHFNYLTPTKSTALKRLPTHSYNNFYQIQKQNLMSKFKDNNGSNKNINNINNINNIKVGTNNGVLSSKKIERKHSLFLPLLEKEKKQKNNNASINNEINGFRKQYKKNVEQNQPNTSEFQINLNGNKNSNEINEDIKENNNNKDEISENIEKEDDDELTKHLYKTKLNSCKQVRLKKKFL
jgi:serine/threonine protein kinase